MSAVGSSGAAKASVLVVDDDADLRRSLTLRLRHEGYHVVEAVSGEAALDVLASQPLQVVITDMQMSGMDGLALYRAIRRHHATLPVIMLTGHGTIPNAVAATKEGVFGYLTKPCDAQSLLNEVERAIRAFAAHPDAGDTPLVTRSPRLRSLLNEARLVAATDASVLIQGDTGSGKELLAQTIHDWSPRRDKEFIAINCGAIPESLLESELFGHVKGAFTGAVRDHHGLFQAAHGGTILLDEVGDMPLPLQVKLLRVLQEREIRPVGAQRTIPVDVRVISATHRDLAAAIEAGRFREDLFYRLNVVNLCLPPLSERCEDIPLLAMRFASTLAAKYEKTFAGFAPEALTALTRYAWPGNVRQLFNTVEKCVALSVTPLIPLSLVERALGAEGDGIIPFDEARRAFEREYLTRLLRVTGGNVSQAARLAQRNRSDFYSLLNRNSIEPVQFKQGS